MQDELEFQVEKWTQDWNHFHVIAKSENITIGVAAFNEAAKSYPTTNLRLRHGARIIRQHPGAEHVRPIHEPSDMA